MLNVFNPVTCRICLWHIDETMFPASPLKAEVTVNSPGEQNGSVCILQRVPRGNLISAFKV